MKGPNAFAIEWILSLANFRSLSRPKFETRWILITLDEENRLTEMASSLNRFVVDISEFLFAFKNDFFAGIVLGTKEEQGFDPKIYPGSSPAVKRGKKHHRIVIIEIPWMGNIHEILPGPL